MVDASPIEAAAEVAAADGAHVDHIENDRIKLTRKDPAPDIRTAHPCSRPLNDVSSTKSGKVWRSAEAALVPVLKAQDEARPV